MGREVDAVNRIVNYWIVYDEENDVCKQVREILPSSCKIAVAVAQAFEIIKKKRVNADFLLDCGSVKEYNRSCELYELDRSILTEEEFALLKEMLSCHNKEERDSTNE